MHKLFLRTNKARVEKTIPRQAAKDNYGKSKAHAGLLTRMVTCRLHGDTLVSLLAGVDASLRKRSSPFEVSAVRRTHRPRIPAPPKDLLHLLQLVANREFHPRVPECRRKFLAEKVKDFSAVATLIPEKVATSWKEFPAAKTFKAAHTCGSRQQAAARGGWSVRVDQHQREIYYTPITQGFKYR